MNNLEYYCRNAVVTEQDLNVLTIGELEKVVSVRKATVGERKSARNSTASKAGQLVKRREIFF